MKCSTEKNKAKVLFHGTVDPFEEVVEKGGFFHLRNFLAFFYDEEEFFSRFLDDRIELIEFHVFKEI